MRRRTMWQIAGVSIVVIGVAWLGSRAWAGLPGAPAGSTMYYSGYLELSGTPVDGSRMINVALWTTAVGGSAPECQTGATSTPVQNGAFRVGLPDACVDAVRANADLFAEVTVGADPPLPRQHIGAVPYAVEAGHAETADEATHAARADQSGLYCDTIPATAVSSALGGYAGVAASCAALPGCGDTAHLCSVGELTRSVASGLGPPSATIGRATGSGASFYIDTVGPFLVNDCQEFTLNDGTSHSNGFVYDLAGSSYPAIRTCNTVDPFFCCD